MNLGLCDVIVLVECCFYELLQGGIDGLVFWLRMCFYVVEMLDELKDIEVFFDYIIEYGGMYCVS